MAGCCCLLPHAQRALSCAQPTVLHAFLSLVLGCSALLWQHHPRHARRHTGVGARSAQQTPGTRLRELYGMLQDFGEYDLVGGEGSYLLEKSLGRVFVS